MIWSDGGDSCNGLLQKFRVVKAKSDESWTVWSAESARSANWCKLNLGGPDSQSLRTVHLHPFGPFTFDLTKNIENKLENPSKVLWTSMTWSCGVIFTSKGVQATKEEAPIIVCTPHSSIYDNLLCSVTQRPFFTVARDERGVLGTLLRLVFNLAFLLVNNWSINDHFLNH